MALKMISQPVGPLQGNCYFIYDGDGRQCVVIDPGEDGELLDSVVEKNGLTVKAVLLTHGHSDHLGATGETAALRGVPVYGSAETRAVLADPDAYMLFPGMPEFAPAEVDNVIAGGEQLYLEGIEVTVHATPGHSPGSLTYSAYDGLFCGDLLFQGSIGRTDLPGGSFDQLQASIRELARIYPDSTPVYPGHGSPTSIGAEKAGNPFLTDIDW